MKLEIGSKISWKCAFGDLKGVIDNIVMDMNAAGNIIPWLVITPEGYTSNLRLAYTDDNMAMMKVQVA